MTDTYALRSPLFLTNRSFGVALFRDAPSEERKRSIDFHIVSNDYFGTIATTLGLIGDTISDNKLNIAKRYLYELRDEFIYLQDTHKIERKDSFNLD
jgi:hypothetical protein